MFVDRFGMLAASIATPRAHRAAQTFPSVGYLRISYSAVTISRDSRYSRVPADQLQCSYN
jgi:hypothetical protein